MYVITHMPDGCQLDVILVMVRSGVRVSASSLMIALRSKNWAGILQCRQKGFLIFHIAASFQYRIYSMENSTEINRDLREVFR